MRVKTRHIVFSVHWKILILSALSGFGSLFSFDSSAQSDVEIIDFSVTNLIPDTSGYINDSIGLIVMFKVNHPEFASKAHILFGTFQGSDDVLNIAVPIVNLGGKYYTNYDNRQEEVINYSAVVFPRITFSQDTTFNHVLLFIEKTDSLNSDTLYYSK